MYQTGGVDETNDTDVDAGGRLVAKGVVRKAIGATTEGGIGRKRAEGGKRNMEKNERKR